MIAGIGDAGEAVVPGAGARIVDELTDGAGTDPTDAATFPPAGAGDGVGCEAKADGFAAGVCEASLLRPTAGVVEATDAVPFSRGAAGGARSRLGGGAGTRVVTLGPTSAVA